MAARIPALLLIPVLSLAGIAARGDPPPDPAAPVDLALDLRFRYEAVDQADVALPADASTLRIRAGLATRDFRGVSGLLELDHVEPIGAERYDDTRNGKSAYPVVADPAGTDLNQAWIQLAAGSRHRVRVGRQRITLGDQRFVGASDWRQNEQTFDALRIESAIAAIRLDYAYVGRVNRAFGPDAGTPPASFEGGSHLLNATFRPVAAGTCTAYAYVLDFDEAPQLSSRSVGVRLDGRRAVRDGVSLGWTLEHARQRDGGDNPLRVDAAYARAELRVETAALEIKAGGEWLSGTREPAGGTANRAFQTPLATLHKWQGWADRFLTTPPAGMRDAYLAFGARRSGWRVQAAWHDFAAEATDLHYGSEFDVAVSGRLGDRYELLLKVADYRADDGPADTRKVWAQLGAAF